MLEKAVELGRVNLSEDDPDVLLTAYHLGRVHQSLDDQPAARRVLEEAYAAGLRRLGDHDPLMVEISHDIGAVAEELGNRHEARKAFTRVAEYGPAALGATHQAVARAQAYLGLAPDSVRSSTPPPAAPAAPTSAPDARLTLVTPVPSAGFFGGSSPFAGEEPTAAVPAPARPASGLVQPPPLTEPVWTAPGPAPSPRRSPEGIDEPTVAHPVITPRRDVGRTPQSGPPSQSPTFDTRSAPPTQAAASIFAAPTTQAMPRGQRVPAPQFEAPTFGHPPTQAAPRSDQAAAGFHQDTPGFGRSRGSFDQMARSFGQSGQRGPVQRPVDQQWAPPPPHRHLLGADAGTAGTLQPGAGASGDGAYRKRGLGLFAAIAAVMASLIAVATLVFVLANRKTDPSPASNVPTLAGRAPTGVKLHDLGSEVDLTWTDPSPGQVSFIVVMAHPGAELKAMTTLGPGTTSYRAGGLNARLDYCFAVAAVYSAKTFATSPQSCTSRGTAGPAPSTGK